MTLRHGALLAITVLFTACGVDIGGGSQLAGQRCFQESDCADGLVCRERVCTPQLGSRPPTDDAGTSDDASGNNDNSGTNNANNNLPDGGLPDFGDPDFGQNCAIGDRRCISSRAYEVCVELEGGISRYRDVACEDNQRCEDGRCFGDEMCRDIDGDGYGDGCRLGPDCDDGNPTVNPGAREDCETPFDDDCDGRENEGCNGCCPMGCGADEFCNTDCVCQDYEPDVCEYQNQPCTNEGSFSNGFGCFSFGGTAEPKCWGICQLNADDPDATCPGENSVCAFDAGDGQNGICMSVCDESANGRNTCGPPDLGCLNLDFDAGEGVCAPINPDNQRDERCDAETFFDCDEGLVCLSFQGGDRGRCQEACRPFARPGMQTDCQLGHCLPFSADFGVCFQDNMGSEGDTCSQPQTACNEDAVGCYPTAQGQTECQRLCRLDEDDDDCQGNDSCTQFDPQQQELGVCL